MSDRVTVIPASAWTTSGEPTGRLRLFRASHYAQPVLQQEMRYKTGSADGAVSYISVWKDVPVVDGHD